MSGAPDPRHSAPHFASRTALADVLTQRLRDRPRLSLPAAAMGLRESAVLIPIL